MPNIEVDVNDLRKHKIMVATPMYGAQCHGMYTNSCINLQGLAVKYGLDVRFHFIFNESLITRARNYLVDEFIRSDCTHLMFIDSDIGFDANDILAMSALMLDEGKYPILCGPYPKKSIAWEKIKAAVDKGLADANPNNLEKYVGDYVFNPVEGATEIQLDRPVEVMEGGTGFMMIERDTFAQYDLAYPHLMYKPDHVRTEHFDGSREIMAYFDCVIDPKSKRYLSEDYMFCQYARAIGKGVFLCPWMHLVHSGSYSFGGSLEDLAILGANPTTDMAAIGKGKKING